MLFRSQPSAEVQKVRASSKQKIPQVRIVERRGGCSDPRILAEAAPPRGAYLMDSFGIAFRSLTARGGLVGRFSEEIAGRHKSPRGSPAVSPYCHY